MGGGGPYSPGPARPLAQEIRRRLWGGGGKPNYCKRLGFNSGRLEACCRDSSTERLLNPFSKTLF